jgi:hypothetical protein
MASPEVNVRIRATDGASPVLTLIQGNLARTAASGALAARGMDRVTDAVKDIGRQAAGVDRDVGNLAVGLINLAGGGTLVTAAVGGLVFAYTQLTAASRAAHDENEKFVTSLVATAEKGAPAAEAIRGMDAAVKDLAFHQRELSGLQNPGASAGWFTAIAPLVYRALGLTAKAQREIADAQTATGQAGEDYVTSTMQASAEAVKFGHASAFVRRQLEAYLDTLRATRDNESKTTDERNAAAKELDSLTSAMGKTIEKGQNLAQSLAEQVNYYGQLAQLHPLTSQQLDELSGVLNAVTAAEQDANTTRKDAIALLGAERQALALLGGEAAKQAEKDLRASVGRSPFTAPQRPADGRSLTPFAVPDGIIDTRSIISPSLVQGLDAGMDEAIRALDKTLAKAAREAQFTQIQAGLRAVHRPEHHGRHYRRLRHRARLGRHRRGVRGAHRRTALRDRDGDGAVRRGGTRRESVHAGHHEFPDGARSVGLGGGRHRHDRDGRGVQGPGQCGLERLRRWRVGRLGRWGLQRRRRPRAERGRDDPHHRPDARERARHVGHADAPAPLHGDRHRQREGTAGNQGTPPQR